MAEIYLDWTHRGDFGGRDPAHIKAANRARCVLCRAHGAAGVIQKSGTFTTSLPPDFVEYLPIASIPIQDLRCADYVVRSADWSCFNCHDEYLNIDSSFPTTLPFRTTSS